MKGPSLIERAEHSYLGRLTDNMRTDFARVFSQKESWDPGEIIRRGLEFLPLYLPKVMWESRNKVRSLTQV